MHVPILLIPFHVFFSKMQHWKQNSVKCLCVGACNERIFSPTVIHNMLYQKLFSDLELLNGLQAAVHSVSGVRLRQGFKCSERRFNFGLGSFLFPGQGRTGTLRTFPPIGTYAPIWIHLPVCCHRLASDADSAGLKPHSVLVHQHPKQRVCVQYKRPCNLETFNFFFVYVTVLSTYQHLFHVPVILLIMYAKQTPN